MTDVVNRRKMRHAHMVNITPEVMEQGMRADFGAVDRLSQAVLDRVKKATIPLPARQQLRLQISLGQTYSTAEYLLRSLLVCYPVYLVYALENILQLSPRLAGLDDS